MPFVTCLNHARDVGVQFCVLARHLQFFESSRVPTCDKRSLRCADSFKMQLVGMLSMRQPVIKCVCRVRPLRMYIQKHLSRRRYYCLVCFFLILEDCSQRNRGSWICASRYEVRQPPVNTFAIEMRVLFQSKSWCLQIDPSIVQGLL
jgi:hypothetical protein